MKKAETVFVRLGFSDKVVSLEDAQNSDVVIIQDESYVAGYEDYHGRECQADGTYLDQDESDK